MGQLNDLAIKAAQPRDKEYLLADGEGLYLRVRPTGKVWVYRYKQSGTEAKLSLGHYPAVSLAAARKRSRAEAEKRAGGIDPREARREEEERERVARLNTFELTARAWHAQAQKDRQWSASYAGKVMRHLELHIFPWIGRLAGCRRRGRATTPRSTIRNSLANCCGTSAGTKGTSSRGRLYSSRRYCSSGPVSCAWRIGKTSTSSRSCGAARPRR